MSQNNAQAEEKQKLADLRHSAAHLLAAAVMELYPDAKRTIGPATDDGFYFDFEFSAPISDRDLQRIDQKMREMGKSWKGFERHELTPDAAKAEYPGNQYKHELIEEFSAAGQTLTFYKSGEYWDLCKGGHIDEPNKQLKHFKLLSIAGAYWRGSEKNTMLTRIYGTAFFTAEDLKQFLEQRELAAARDHRKLGKELDLFFIDEMVGKGLVMWLPKGTIVKDEVEKLAKEMEAKGGYVRVTTPHIAREELYLTSGHLPYYKDSMFPGMEMDDATYYMKAMNCPHHHRMFLYKPRSYRELPLRFAEYGTCYRNELSGTLAGLLRVRGLAMNDAHIYCRKSQIKDEFKSVLELTMNYFKIFGLKDYWFRLSKWDPAHTDKYINEPDNWQYAEQVLREVLEEMNVPYVEANDEAAFYGPKVDVQFKSAIGREETMSTIQLDFLARARFGLSYVDEHGVEDKEVFVIHRAPLSVHERFMAFLIEHYGGAFPTWLAPVQVKVLPIADRHLEYAAKVVEHLKAAGARVELDDRSERLPAKIRHAQQEKVPYMLILGDKEVEESTVSVRRREGGEQSSEKLSDFSSRVATEIAART